MLKTLSLLSPNGLQVHLSLLRTHTKYTHTLALPLLSMHDIDVFGFMADHKSMFDMLGSRDDGYLSTFNWD